MHIGIVGLGVMGGSLLMALSKEQCQISVVSRSPNSQAWAKERGAKVYAKTELLPGDLDFVFLATPSQNLKAMAESMLHLSSKTIISDMASTKGEVVSELGKILINHSYLSCHPMCGSEKTGLEGAKSDLYQHKTVILTPHSDSAKILEPALKAFWEKLHCRTVSLAPQQHDQAVAWISHMPHLVIPILVQAIAKGEQQSPGSFSVAGTGLRDISRLAASNPELWRDILMDNREALKIALSGVQTEIELMLNMLNQPPEYCAQKLESYLADARKIHSDKGLAKI
jgi:prephenate dehydrogenase